MLGQASIVTVLIQIASLGGVGRRRVTAVVVRVRVGVRMSCLRRLGGMRMSAREMLAVRSMIVNRW